jgi:hypothetical protein
MARPRKPTKLLELSGAFDKNPNRARPDEPQDGRPLGDPPSRLPADVVPYWRELEQMVVGGVLTFRDRWAVELAARLMFKAVSGEIGSAELSMLRSLLGSIGMTPADRSKLSIPNAEKPKNKFSALAAEVTSIKRA